MSKKPKIFKPNMNFKDNNKKAYYSFLEEYTDDYVSDEVNVSDFIDNLSNNSSYVFSKRVIIETEDKKYDTRIAGRFGNKIITLDNDIIDISNISNIYEKK